MSVYFIQEYPRGYVKIGFAENDVMMRLAALQTGNPRLLKVVGIIDGAGVEIEAELHNAFRAARVRGEWFRPTPELMSYIKESSTEPAISTVASDRIAKRRDSERGVMTGSEIENALGVNNWLGIVTYDAFKFAAIGGKLRVQWTDEGLALVLPGVTPDHPGLNSKFMRKFEPEKEAVQP